MTSRRRVVVTGLGAVTSIGTTAPEFWKNLLAGTCGIRPVSLFDASAYRTRTAAEVGEIPDGFLSAAEKRRMSRADRMGLAAAAEALAQSGLDPAREDPTRIGVILGGGTSGLLDSEQVYEKWLHGRKGRPSRVLNHLPDAITDRVAQRFGLEGIKSTITTACSSAANAMGYAFDAIVAGLADAVVTGGSDVLARLTYGGFNSLRSVERAVRYEISRHAAVLAGGGSILQETRHWHEDTGVTTSGREKSDAEDYRYFPEPDLVPVAPSREWVDELRQDLRVGARMAGLVQARINTARQVTLQEVAGRSLPVKLRDGTARLFAPFL